jgi:hypothetical protein
MAEARKFSSKISMEISTSGGRRASSRQSQGDNKSGYNSRGL